MTDLVGALLDAFDDDALARLAAALAPRLLPLFRDELEPRCDDGWMDADEAARYLGMKTANALHKLTAERAIPFCQEAPGCKTYFKRSELDEWRRSGGARQYLRRAR